MRGILFRGKREDNGEWVEGYYIHQDKRQWANESYRILRDDGFSFPIVPSTVGQYTGLTDKNGRKIFEGDIMHNTGNVVEFYNGDFCINGDSPLSYWTGTEVIGNIYDKIELSEVKQNG